MRNAGPSNPIPWRVFAALLVCLWMVSSSKSDIAKDRKKAAKNLVEEIERAQFHKIYVADFLDSSGTRTEKGCFFASTFSSILAKDSRNFEVVNRIQAQKQFNELHISPQDLLKPEILAKAAQALGADAVLLGTATISPKDGGLILSLREAASGKEVHTIDYHEKLEPAFDTSFPAVEDATNHYYYFPGLDGVSNPKCLYCPNPDYTDEARQHRVSGNVVLSISIDEKGAITNARVVTNPDDDLTQKAVNILKKWRMEPSHDMNGNPVPVRVPVEIVFRLLG